jgi:hypothetical protein
MSEPDNVVCPPDGNPEDRIPKVSAICSYGMRPHVVTGLLRQLLITHFSDPNNIEERQLRQKFKDDSAWKPDANGENKSGILIESITRWTPNSSNKRPAVLIKRNSWQWQKIGLGDSVGYNPFEGGHNYTGLWQGSHTLYCLAAWGLETELLAMEVVKFLLHFSPWIREQMGFKKFYIHEVGGVGEVQEVVQGYAVPVTVAYVAEESWTLQPAAPRLKRIVLKASELFSC